MILWTLWARNKRLIVGSISLALIHSISVFRTYGWSDDWGLYQDYTSHTLHALKDGRPLFALLLEGQFKLAQGKFSTLWLPRMWGLVGIIFLYCLLVEFFRKEFQYLSLRTTKVVSWLVMPAFLSLSCFWITSWATISSWILAPIFSSIAALVLLGSRDRKTSALELLMSSTLILFAVLIYPLNACYGLIFFVIAIAASKEKEDQKQVEKKMRTFLGLNLFVVLLWWVFYPNLLRLYSLEVNLKISDKIGIEDIPEKFIWLLTRPVFVSLTPFNFHTSFLPLIFFGLFSLGIIFYVLKIFTRFRSNRSKSIHVLVAYLFSFWPLVISSSNQIDHRLLLVPSSIFLIFISIGVMVGLHIERSRISKYLLNGFVALSLSLGVGNQIFLSQKLFVEPFNETRELVRESFLNCLDLQNTSTVVFKRTYYRDYFPYLGNLSVVSDINHPWTPKPLIELIIKNDLDRTVQAFDLLMDDRDSTKALFARRSICFIDLDKLS